MSKILILILSGGYFFFLGWIPDPLLFVDEGVALALFIKTLANILKDRSAKRSVQKSEPEEPNAPIIDVD